MNITFPHSKFWKYITRDLSGGRFCKGRTLKKKKIKISELNSTVNGKEKIMNFGKNQNIFLPNAVGKNLWSAAHFERQIFERPEGPGNHPWLMGRGWRHWAWMCKPWDATTDSQHRDIPQSPAQHLLSQLQPSAGLQGPPGPLTCRENKIWSNLHHWESTGRWILGLSHRKEAVLGAGAGDGKQNFLLNSVYFFFFFFTIKRIYNKTSAPQITNLR